MPRKERILKQKETAKTLAAHGTINIRAWFRVPHPTQTPTEIENSKEEPLSPTKAENLNTTETPSETGNRYLWTSSIANLKAICLQNSKNIFSWINIDSKHNKVDVITLFQ